MSSNSVDLVRRLLALAILAVSLAIIALFLLSMGLGILVVFSTPEGLQFSRDHVILDPLLFIDMSVSVNAGFFFVFLWWVFVLCFAVALQTRRGIASRIRETPFDAQGHVSLFRNNLLAMPAITSMLLVAVLVLNVLQSLGGIPTGSPIVEGDPFLDFLRFSRAPVVEEVVFRVLPLGAFLVTYIPLAGKKATLTWSRSRRLKLAFLSIVQPDTAKSMVEVKTIDKHGLFGGTIWAEWVMVVFTALVFGFAHYTGGTTGGWQVGKISQAALSGLVFAIAYLYYGVQAPILLHWFFNYYLTVFYLARDYLAAVDLASLTWFASLSFGIFMWFATLAYASFIFYRDFLRKVLGPQPRSPPVQT